MRAALLFSSVVLLALLTTAAGSPGEYLVRRTERPPVFAGDWEQYWNSPPWDQTPALSIRNFHQQSDPPYPVSQVKLLYSQVGLHLFFRVEDRYVRSVRTQYQDAVWRDACVEFFFEPIAGGGYVNVEVNAGGAFLMKYHPREEGTAAAYGVTPVPWEEARELQVKYSLPEVIETEIAGPVTWHIQYSIPFDLLEKYFGPLRPVSGRFWRANFYKISLDNSHPHAATWAPIPVQDRAQGFHQPRHFGVIRFEGGGRDNP